MTTLPNSILVEIYLNSHTILQKQTEGISQEESLLQLPFRGNCMNWVIGHILGIRGDALELMGLPGTMNPAEKQAYGYGSEPITCPEKACDLVDMLRRLDESLPRVIDALTSLSVEDMEREVRIWRGPMPLVTALAYVQWHESFHTGQLEQLRQLAGKNDKVI